LSQGYFDTDNKFSNTQGQLHNHENSAEARHQWHWFVILRLNEESKLQIPHLGKVKDKAG
jgi:hypothetical protein